MSVSEVLLALLIAVGLAGVVLPVLPGSALVLLAVVVWAVLTAQTAGWVVLGVAATLLVAGSVVKYVVPGRRLGAAGIPARTQLAGLVVGVVGFFVVPVIGLPIGFVLGIWSAERIRLGGRLAWPSTRTALRAIGLSILIELLAALAATAVWVVGLLVTTS